MIDFTTKYLGLDLKNPLVVSSNPLCEDIDNLRQMEAAGASAIVLPSLFAEQLTLTDSGLDYYVSHNPDMLPERFKHIPDMKGFNKGASGYIAHLYQAKKAVNIPIIASLNGSAAGGWVQHAATMEKAGADAIELNLYFLPTELHISSHEIEQMYLHLLYRMKKTVDIPVAVKLSPDFSALPFMVHQLEEAGADALILFNRFYQPDFDLDTETVVPNLNLSESSELLLRLRWTAILRDKIKADLAITGGVHTAEDAIKGLLAGADVLMLASALLQNGIEHLQTMLSGMEEWMADKKYGSVNEIRGRMSQQRVSDPATLERANYMRVLRSYATEEDVD